MELVTVICLCYNQSRFIEDAVASVFSQTYKNIELIVVNDGSKDDSSKTIQALCLKYPSIRFIDNNQNMGMCRSFNKALEIARGAFIIDLAADDVLLPERIEKQVKVFEDLDETWGVVFTDAYLIDEEGKGLGTFYRRDRNMQLSEQVISGDIFSTIVKKYQICAPTIMIRKKVLTELGGYDASLKYEDYDFYIRSSRNYKYYFLNEILTRKRNVKGSDSSGFYSKKNNPHLASTLKVLTKYLWLCRNREEMRASLFSIRYHMRQSLFMECFPLVKEYYALIKDLNRVSVSDMLFYAIAYLHIPLYSFYSFYRKTAHNK